jgi:hypothetical protein
MSNYEYPFLQTFYEEKGIRPGQELGPGTEPPAGISDIASQKIKVATRIVDLLIAGEREFPTVTLPDPTGTLELDLQLVTERFDAVTYTDLLGRDHKVNKGFKAAIELISPYRNSPEQYRRVGGLQVEKQARMTDIEAVSLARADARDEDLQTGYLKRDSKEVFGFIGLTAAYLDAIAE